MKMRFAVFASAFALVVPALAAVSGPADWESAAGKRAAAWIEDHGGTAVVFNASNRTVTLLAEATGLAKGEAMEFFLAGPLTDRAYETCFVSHASPAEIAAAFDRIGIPRGVPVDAAEARFWPVGERVEVSLSPVGGDSKRLSVRDFIADTAPGDDPDPFAGGIVFTGGSRDSGDAPVAATNIPCAVFSTYSHAPAMLQFASPLDQSAAYGRFTAGCVMKAGELVEISFAWDGKRKVRDWVVEVAPGGVSVCERGGKKLKSGDFKEVSDFLRECAKDSAVYLEPSFDRELPLAKATAAARFFEAVDGKGVRVNGRGKGQIYFRGYCPRDEWRDRSKRMAQPFEIRLGADGTNSFTFIEEDWSAEAMEPKLVPHETKFSKFAELPGLVAKTGRQGEKMDVAFIFAPSASPLGPILDAADALGRRVGTVYVFSE